MTSDQNTLIHNASNKIISTSSVGDECESISNLIRLLNTTIPLIWLCLGTCTNILSLVIFMRANLRINSTFFYLALMTASDLIVIWLSSLRDFMVYKYGIYVAGSIACKLHVFSFFLFAQFSSWMLVAASFDRLVLVVSYNSFSKVWCTKANAKRFALVLFLVIVALNFHFVINVQTIDESAPFGLTEPFKPNESPANTPTLIHPIVYPLCKSKPGLYSKFYTKYYVWIDSFMYSFLPFFIICICNYTLIKKVSFHQLWVIELFILFARL